MLSQHSMIHLLVAIFLCLTPLSNASPESFIGCLTKYFTNDQLHTILYTPKATNYTSILLQNLRASRYNTSTTLKPNLILTPFHESQVQPIVKCAKKTRLQIKTRSGGHDFEGLSYTARRAPFVMLDLFHLRSIEINIEDQTAWVQSGTTLGELYYRIWEKSNALAFPAGFGPTVGIGGHISGGGYGTLLRKYGLSIDHVVDAKIVNAEGRILHRKQMGEDLFWAIRGGGGASFGVVLSYKVKLVPVPPVVTVFLVTKTVDDNTTDIIHRWQHVADKIDNDLFLRANIYFNVGAEKIRGVDFTALYLGNATQLVSLMEKEFPELGLKIQDCKAMSWTESVIFWAELPDKTPETDLAIRKPPSFGPFKIKSDYVKTPISKEGLRGLVKRIESLGDIEFGVRFIPYGGRMSEIAEDATPFPHRAGNIYKLQYVVNWFEKGDEVEKKNLEAIRGVYDYMTPFVSKNPRGAFFNYRDLEIGSTENGEKAYEEGRVYGEKYFKANFDRLVKVKTKVDPDNFFRDEQSIPVLKK